MTKKLLGTVLAVCESLSEEVPLLFTADGIKAKVVDPAHVAMVDLAVTVPEMTSYDIVGDLSVTVHVKPIKEAMKLGTDDSVSLEFTDSTGYLLVTCGKVKRKVRVEEVRDLPRVPPLPEGDAEFAVQSSDIAGLTAIAGKDGVLRIVVDDGAEFSVLDGDLSFTEPGIKSKSGSMVKASYPSAYMDAIVKAIGGTMELSFSNDYPLVVRARPDLIQTCTVLVAPRIEDDSDMGASA